MARARIRVKDKVIVILDNGIEQTFRVNDLKQLMLSGQIHMENMYITDLGTLMMKKDKSISAKYNSAMHSSNNSSNRKAGWHSGGEKKPYGFTHGL